MISTHRPPTRVNSIEKRPLRAMAIHSGAALKVVKRRRVHADKGRGENRL